MVESNRLNSFINAYAMYTSYNITYVKYLILENPSLEEIVHTIDFAVTYYFPQSFYQESNSISLLGENEVLITSKLNVIISIIDKKAYYITANQENFSFSGVLVSNPKCKYSDWIVLRLTNFNVRMFVSSEKTNSNNKFNSLLWGVQAPHLDNKSIFIVIRKKDISNIKVVGFKQLKHIRRFKKLNSFTIHINSWMNTNYKKIENISLLPKEPHLTFIIDRNQRELLNNPHFWSKILCFKNIKIVYDSSSWNIACTVESLNQENVFNSTISIREENSKRIVSIDSFLKMMKKS